MIKLKALMRFSNAFDGKVYDKDDEFEASESDSKYLLNHKIASKVKEEKEDKPKRKG